MEAIINKLLGEGPRWRTVRTINFFVMLMCIILALNTYPSPSWAALLDAFFGGAALGLVVWITIGAIPAQRNFEEMRALTEMLVDQNDKLLDELSKLRDTWRGLGEDQMAKSFTPDYTESRVCPYCMRWCATSDKQLVNRLKNIAAAPDVKAYECPKCGSTDWATTRAMIRTSTAKPLWKFWK